MQQVHEIKNKPQEKLTHDDVKVMIAFNQGLKTTQALRKPCLIKSCWAVVASC
jgi:hypothetical protein